jgi:hypothetical protein
VAQPLEVHAVTRHRRESDEHHGPWTPQYYICRPYKYVPVLHIGDDKNFGYEHYDGATTSASVPVLEATARLTCSTPTDEPSSPWWLLRRSVDDDGLSLLPSPFHPEEVDDAHSRLVPHWFKEPLTEGVELRLKTPWLLFDHEPSVDDFPAELKADWPMGVGHSCKDEVEVEQCEEGGEEDFGKGVVVALRGAGGGEQGKGKGKGKRAKGAKGGPVASENGRYKARLVRPLYDHSVSSMCPSNASLLLYQAALGRS